MRSARLRQIAILLWLANAGTSFGQTLAELSELQRLRDENRELRARLAEVEAKLKETKPKATPTPPQPIEPAHTSEVVAGHLVSPTFLDKIFLRKSVFTEDTLDPGNISWPAQFTFEHSGNGTNTYAIDTGVAATFLSTPLAQSQIDWGAGLDYHRSSLPHSPKNLFQTGVIADSAFGDPTLSSLFALAKTNLSFKDNQAKKIQSITGGLDLLPVERKFLKIDDPHDLGIMRWRWQPFAGVRWDASTDVPGGRANGHQILARYGVETQFFPLYSYANFKKSLEAALRLTAWSDISSSGVYRGKDWRGYLDLNVTYWFNGGLSLNKEKASLGFGLAYEKGDNPDFDQTDIDLLALSLKAKF